MPRKINMVISNNNYPSMFQPKLTQTASNYVPKPSSALNAPLISRIHTTKPGCGSCGR